VRFSVIIPTANRARSLGLTLESLCLASLRFFLGAANRQQRTALRAAAIVIFALGIVNQLDEWARNLVPDRQVRYEAPKSPPSQTGLLFMQNVQAGTCQQSLFDGVYDDLHAGTVSFIG